MDVETDGESASAEVDIDEAEMDANAVLSIREFEKAKMQMQSNAGTSDFNSIPIRSNAGRSPRRNTYSSQHNDDEPRPAIQDNRDAGEGAINAPHPAVADRAAKVYSNHASDLKSMATGVEVSQGAASAVKHDRRQSASRLSLKKRI